MLLGVGEVAVQDVGDGAEQHVGDRRALEFVLRAGIHLVDGLRRHARVESSQRAGRGLAPRHQARHAVDGFGAVHLVEVGEQLHRIGVVDDGLVADAPQRHRHDVEVDGRQLVESEFVADLRRRRELQRAGDLESVPVEKLYGGGHSAGVQLGVQAERAHARLLQKGRRGKSVVTRADDDRVEVRHRPRLARRPSFVNNDET